MDKEKDEMNEENVEEFMQKAIEKYGKMGNLVDFIFWREAIRLFKNKIIKETSEKVLRQRRDDEKN